MEQIMQGKTVIVTGANSGIGYVTARELAKMGARVMMVCRSQSKGEAARQRIAQEATGAPPELVLADFASLHSVRRAASELLERCPRIDVLVNNAGIFVSEPLASADGYELTFAVNHLAPFLLTNLLLDRIVASAPARIVNVSSFAHVAGKIAIPQIASPQRPNIAQAYSDSKLCNILFTNELARRLQGSGVTANSLHPGAVATNFAADARGLFAFFFRLARPFMLSPEQGAETSIYLASSPEVEGVSGVYFVRKKPTQPSAAAQDAALARRLWEFSEQLVREKVVAV
ncbi:MAG: SDR family oxidoreductase [Chloroflexus sp.]|nr:SDR family oxidoreductase [Chloroflexus sp.]MBO9373580.1 SDR family oxidoreductase [Chloroflexus sp.]